MYDYVIIGAGIIGTTIARKLSQYQVKVLVLEKENDVANHQTVANSAIIHSGHDPQIGTLKAKLCVEGNSLYEQMEKDLEIPLLKTGAFVVAHNKNEERQLKKLQTNAIANGVKNTEIFNRERAFANEPNLALNVSEGLSLPSTKVTYPWEVAFACLENAIANGVEFVKNSEVTKIEKTNFGYHIEVNLERTVKAKSVINAAGIFCDKIAKMIETDVLYQITPRKGEYFVLDKKVKGLVNHVLYPLPSKKGKGVLITPQVHGNILLGPTSTLVSEKEVFSNTTSGLMQIKSDIKHLAHDVPFDKTIRTFAGIRASSTYHDFFIQESREFKNFFHVAGIDSPGLTAAPAIANYLVHDVMKHLLVKKTDYNPIRKKPEVFHNLNDKQKQKRIKKDPRFGNIICRCEKITEAEIVRAITGSIENDTIKGIKKRARAGSGICQGGYCENLVLKLIAKHTNQDIDQINYYSVNSKMLVSKKGMEK